VAAAAKVSACTRTIVEPLGTSRRNEAVSPATVASTPSTTESSVIWARVRARRRAVAAGITR